MNRYIAVFAGACLALLLPLSTNAAGPDWYVGFDAGQAHYAGLMDNLVTPAGTTSHTSDNDNSFRLTGGIQFNKYWGAELSWVDFGSAEVDLMGLTAADTASAKVKAHGIVLAATGTYPLSDQWSIFARFGGINGHKEDNWTGQGSLAGYTGNVSSTDWKVTYGIGANWSFHPNWRLRLGYDQYMNIGNHNKTGEGNINVLSVGIAYQF